MASYKQLVLFQVSCVRPPEAKILGRRVIERLLPKDHCSIYEQLSTPPKGTAARVRQECLIE
eukprot:8777524-Alexandrium_andersonii.AAC.1